MNTLLKNKTLGFYIILASAAAALISLVRYGTWASAHNAMDATVAAALVIGIVLNLILTVKDEDILVVVSVVCYSYALFRHLTSQVGSFVDSFQGINMFGDATQVGTIISIATVMAIGVVLCIIAAFMRREKDV